MFTSSDPQDLQPELYFEDGQVVIRRLIVGPIDNNVFFVQCRNTSRTLLVDAANDPDVLLPLCRSARVEKALTTHGHWDHVAAVPAVRSLGVQVGIGEGDADRLADHDWLIRDGDVIDVGQLRIRCIATPGHTPGSTCYALEGSPVLFSGDTLFPGGPGATHFPGGDFPTIMESLQRLFLELPGETVVMPGHGSSTTINSESPRLAEWRKWGS